MASELRPTISAALVMVNRRSTIFSDPGANTVALSRAMMGMIIFNVLMEAAALSMMTPMLSSLRMQVLEREERARMFSFTTMLALLVTAPFGAVTGWLSQVNRSLPMLLNVGLAILSVMVCLRLDRELRDKDIL